jgi:acyl-CoA thioesterase FadM
MWFQEAAFEHSASIGWGMDTYDTHNSTWVMRIIDVEFLHPAHYLDGIEIRTWVSDFQRVRSHREYEAIRVSDATLFAPKRVPQQMGDVFVPNGKPALAPIQWHAVTEGESLGHFEMTRRVQQYELDQMQHVNNTVYLNWIEQQMHEAWRAWNQDIAVLNARRHFVEYRQQAVGDDELRLVSDAARMKLCGNTVSIAATCC